MKSIDHILAELKGNLTTLYGQRLTSLLLYGSWARGNSTDSSDIDVAVVLKGEVNPSEEIDRMIQIVSDLNLLHGALISIYPVSEEGYKTVQSPLLNNIRSEGIAA